MESVPGGRRAVKHAILTLARAAVVATAAEAGGAQASFGRKKRKTKVFTKKRSSSHMGTISLCGEHMA